MKKYRRESTGKENRNMGLPSMDSSVQGFPHTRNRKRGKDVRSTFFFWEDGHEKGTTFHIRMAHG